MGLISAPDHPVTVASKLFAEKVKNGTNGMIDIQVIPGGALGGEVEMQDMLSKGILDLASFGSAIPSNYNPEFQLLQMPFLWDSPDMMLAFANSEIQEQMNEKYREKSGIRILASNWDQGLRHVASRKPIKDIEDFKGVKMRVPQVPSWVDVWQSLGCTVVMLPFTEVYTALQQGVCDAVEPPLYWVHASSLYEVAKNVTLTGHVMYYNQVFINDKLYSNMSVKTQKVLRDAALEAGIKETETVQNLEKELRKKLEEKGVQFYEIDREKIASAVISVYDKWQDAYGADLRRKVEAFKAEYRKKNR
ncbi:MAG: sialic acid TRAP transporter substrate-binding protein SiaP [Spirochaetales bacterium]